MDEGRTAVAVVHATERRSRANGPGLRYVVWFQGCDLGCPGCYNPETHTGTGGRPIPVDELAGDIEAAAAEYHLDGVSFSGGEPMQQPEALLALVRELQRRSPRLSRLVFSGYRRQEIERMPLGPELLAGIDVLIDGRFVSRRRLGHQLRGSENQTIHLLSSRHRREDVEATPATEVRIGPSGEVILTGVDPLSLD